MTPPNYSRARKIAAAGYGDGPRRHPCVCGAPRAAHSGTKNTGGHEPTRCRRYRRDTADALAEKAIDADHANIIDDIMAWHAHAYPRPTPPPGGLGIGPSDYGRCGRAIYYRERPPADLYTNEVDHSAATLGSIWHHIIRQARQWRYPWRKFEFEVSIPGLDRPGRVDEFDPVMCVVTDWKSVSANQWEERGQNGEREEHFGQVAIYGYALICMGYQVRTMRIIYINRETGESEIFDRPYDEHYAKQALGTLHARAMAIDLGQELDRDGRGPSGDIVCRLFCLSGETEVVTRDGIRHLRELSGQRPMLLVPSQRADGGLGWHAEWRECAVRSYGIQPLRRVELRRGRQKKIVYATPEHRWITGGVAVKPRPKHIDWKVTTTDELTPGMRLRSIRRNTLTTLREVPFAVAQGFVYGDGSAPHARDSAGSLTIYKASPKDKVMLPYFSGHHITQDTRGWHINMLPRTWKDAPRLDESRSFLLSWLAGYIAADGTVSKAGQVTVHSARRESIDLIRSICAIVGVGYSPIKTYLRKGLGQAEPSELHSVNIRLADLPEWFFKIEEHRVRAAAIEHATSPRNDWLVHSVQQTDRVEEVFCAEVPDVEAFALADELLTMNCPYRDYCWNVPQAEAAGRSPESYTILGPNPDDDSVIWAAEQVAEWKTNRTIATKEYEASTPLLVGIPDGTYGTYVIKQKSRRMPQYKQFYEEVMRRYEDYLNLPEDQRGDFIDVVRHIPLTHRKDTWPEVKRTRAATRTKENPAP